MPPLQTGWSYSYTLVGSLPPGLSFDPATGEISGTPTSALSSAVDVTVSVTLSTGTFTATTHVGLTIQDYTITFTYPQLPPIAVGETFLLVPNVSGTIGATSFAVEGGLPPGVTLDPFTGEISGTMTSDLIGRVIRVALTDEYSTVRATAILEGFQRSVVEIPVLPPSGLALLGLLLAGAAFLRLRKRSSVG